MIIGSNVTTVQRVSSYCLKKTPYIFPYYGVPTDEEMNLFAPNIIVLCLPLPENFQHQICQPYILWSEDLTLEGQSFVNSPTDLYDLLHEVVQA
ncbi:MAG: hypothetical protein KME32_22570 [Mojavia pulchra JT2-VF2]|uniref:Uncharacterized protein n=1 Tax=Mojavia pulchra JT2-VF2 TaxID=287848 RepID=A0A951Q1X2_9NOST|nr:hypothetical protein [Mojavia pulchra JT2-VF2]